MAANYLMGGPGVAAHNATSRRGLDVTIETVLMDARATSYREIHRIYVAAESCSVSAVMAVARLREFAVSDTRLFASSADHLRFNRMEKFMNKPLVVALLVTGLAVSSVAPAMAASYSSADMMARQQLVQSVTHQGVDTSALAPRPFRTRRTSRCPASFRSLRSPSATPR